MNKNRSFALQSHSFGKAIKPSDSKYDLNVKPLNRYFPKDAHQKFEGGVSEVRFKKNSTPSPWKRRNFLRNGCLRVKTCIIF